MRTLSVLQSVPGASFCSALVCNWFMFGDGGKGASGEGQTLARMLNAGSWNGCFGLPWWDTGVGWKSGIVGGSYKGHGRVAGV